MQAGDFFNGRYVIEKVLGQGGMGTVYKARNINTDTYWAIKEISRHEEDGFDLLAGPKLLKKLDHPAFPLLFDIFEQDGKLYMISDYISGTSLDKKIETEGRLDEEIVVDWAIQLCKALDYLHALKPNPVIYRDMKPSNIILTDNGSLKLIDFGIAREYKPESPSDTVYIGTRGYAAPEQYGRGQTSALSDIYSLGVTLHQMLTGKNPAGEPAGLRPVRFYDDSLSIEIESVIQKCTADDPADRYQSAAELLAEFEKLQQIYGTVRQCYPGRDKSGKVPADAMHQVNEDRKINSCKPGYSFRKLVIAIWDNAEFGCELAYAASKYTGSEVMLADLDLMAPKADLFLNLGKYSSRSAQAGIFGHSGLDTVMDAIGKGMLTSALLQQASVTLKEQKNLHVITGNYKLENYEYYSEESVPKLIDKCYRNYDITILLVNRFIYDAFTLAALLRSDINVAAIRGDVDRFREFNTYISFLKEKQQLPLENTKFVLFEYDNASSMSIAEAAEATQGNLLGKVSASKKRRMYTNMRSPYACHMERDIVKEYIQLLTKLELLPASGVLHKLGSLAGRIHGRLQSV